MNKLSRSFISVCLVGLITGCATAFPVGGFYTNLDIPVNATGSGSGSQSVGTASCTSILALVATGDCSIEAAKRNGNITTVSHVDWNVKNILGIYGQYKVTVYGQ